MARIRRATTSPRVTMKQVAAEAEVSAWVVSMVLNDRWREEHISEACAERVRETMRALGYVPNRTARSLRTGRTGAIGLVLPADKTLDHAAFASALIQGVESMVSERGHDLMLIGRGGSANEVDRALERLRLGRIDGLIIPGTLGCLATSAGFATASGAIVVTFPMSPSPHRAVDLDPAPGMVEAVEHLAGLGHREVMWFSPPATGHDSPRRRLAPLRAAASRLGIPVREEPFTSPPGVDSGRLREVARRRFHEVLREGRPPTAVICFNDAIAIGACQAAHDLGLIVPLDLSVIGFDDLSAASASPPLTTVSHEVQAVGRRAVQIALELIDGGTAGGSARPETVPSRLVVRESTARAGR
jgi:DNA-binding LacI/PurR family transcriptional regulator